MGLSQGIREAITNLFGDSWGFSLVKREGSLVDGAYYEDESYEEEYADVEALIGDVEKTVGEIYGCLRESTGESSESASRWWPTSRAPKGERPS